MAHIQFLQRTSKIADYIRTQCFRVPNLGILLQRLQYAHFQLSQNRMHPVEILHFHHLIWCFCLGRMHIDLLKHGWHELQIPLVQVISTSGMSENVFRSLRKFLEIFHIRQQTTFGSFGRFRISNGLQLELHEFVETAFDLHER